MEPRTLGDRLVLARRRRFLTQTQLADSAGVAVVTIARLEREHDAPNPRASTITKLAEALDVDPGWLAFGDETGKAAA
jgi:transcriptional regulator with XRE-family HTH domain